MNDLISRQDALDALMAWEEDSVWDDECLKHREEPYWVAPSDVIEKLPSAQRKGKWIRESLSTNYPYKCSACKKYSRAMYDFCPNCGADLRGGEDAK